MQRSTDPDVERIRKRLDERIDKNFEQQYIFTTPRRYHETKAVPIDTDQVHCRVGIYDKQPRR